MGKRNGTLHLLPILAGVVLSASGIALLGIDLRSGVGGWTAILLQGLGLLGGTWCFVVATRRMKWSGAPESSSLPSVVLFPVARDLLEPFLAGRVLVAQIVGFLAVIAVGTMILYRDIVRGPNATSAAKGSLAVLLIACPLVYVVFLFGRLAAAITLAVAAAAMLLVAGYRRWHAVAILTVPLVLFCWQLQSKVARISATEHLRSAISGLRDVRRAPVADWLTSGQPYRKGHWFWLFNLPPDLARNVTVVKVAGVSGLGGVVAVAVMFGVIGWSGARGVGRAETPAERVMLAGITVALVTPVLLQSVGGLLFVNARAGGPLPFIGYGPGELVLHWIMLAYVARQERPRETSVSPCL